AGGRGYRVPVTLRSIPIFARAGSLIFEHPAVQHTGELRGQPLRVVVMPGADGEATLYEDDGETRAYAQGMSVTRRFRHRTTADRETIAIGAPDGPFRPAPRDLWLLVRRERLVTANRLDEAASIANEALARRPESARAHYLLGVVHERRQQLDAAAAEYRAAIARAPKLAEAHDRLGFVLGTQGRTD